jgi:tetratricopeptide (TPR) repeat protein
MELKRILLVVRCLIAAIVGIPLFRWAGSKLAEGGGWDPGLAFEILVLLLLYGLLLFGLFGFSVINKVASYFGGIFWPVDEDVRIVPEYSIAEARAKEGKYEEAIEEYRTVIVQHPNDAYPHLRIAELALQHLHDPRMAEAELLSSLGKAEREGVALLAAGRLADFYQQTLHEPRRALEVMKKVREKVLGTKLVQRVDERIATLEKMAGGYQVPKPPDKITVKPADEAEIRRRRGF